MHNHFEFVLDVNDHYISVLVYMARTIRTSLKYSLVPNSLFSTKFAEIWKECYQRSKRNVSFFFVNVTDENDFLCRWFSISWERSETTDSHLKQKNSICNKTLDP
jgi:hypothetical protein